MTQSATPVNVLLVEDNEGDVNLVKEALKAIGSNVALTVMGNGAAAIEFIKSGKESLSFIILDLNLPQKNGYEVLEELKADPHFRLIPVVIFTSSAAVKDIGRAYRTYANSYVRKPADIDEFFDAVAGIERYWTKIAATVAV